ncbi:MAG: hypothetical protein DMD82_16635, partial [Candidatus Rokuibacteriota bacterium]
MFLGCNIALFRINLGSMITAFMVCTSVFIRPRARLWIVFQTRPFVELLIGNLTLMALRTMPLCGQFIKFL